MTGGPTNTNGGHGKVLQHQNIPLRGSSANGRRRKLTVSPERGCLGPIPCGKRMPGKIKGGDLVTLFSSECHASNTRAVAFLERENNRGKR